MKIECYQGGQYPNKVIQISIVILYTLLNIVKKMLMVESIMEEKNWSIKKISLKFIDNEIEEKYEKMILEKMRLFSSLGWGIIAFLGIVFSFLDEVAFGEKADVVFPIRAILVTFSLILFLLLRFNRIKWIMKWSSSLFILILGAFCVFLSTLCDERTFPLYSVSLVLAFSGLFCTTGFGFKYIVTSIITVIAAFEIVIGYTVPVSMEQHLLSSSFVWSFAFVFCVMAYILESISRNNFVVSEKLQKSLDDVKQLSGILPICAKCKKIRDDKGYWEQVEDYIGSHSDALFSHGLCPNCVDELYPDLGINEKLKKKGIIVKDSDS